MNPVQPAKPRIAKKGDLWWCGAVVYDDKWSGKLYTAWGRSPTEAFQRYQNWLHLAGLT